MKTFTGYLNEGWDGRYPSKEDFYRLEDGYACDSAGCIYQVLKKSEQKNIMNDFEKPVGGWLVYFSRKLAFNYAEDGKNIKVLSEDGRRKYMNLSRKIGFSIVNQGWKTQDFIDNFDTYHEAYNAAFTGQDADINQYLSEIVNNFPQHKNNNSWEPLWKELKK